MPGMACKADSDFDLELRSKTISLAAQAAQHLYVFSSEKEKVALLAEIGAYVRSMDAPSYPSE